MTLFADTNVWSDMYRRDVAATSAEARALVSAINTGQTVVTAGLVLQELLEGFHGPRSREGILQRFAALPLIEPDRDDYIEAASLRNRCRRAGRQVETIDALLAQLCVRHDLTMLSADKVFEAIAPLVGLRVWAAR